MTDRAQWTCSLFLPLCGTIGTSEDIRERGGKIAVKYNADQLDKLDKEQVTGRKRARRKGKKSEKAAKEQLFSTRVPAIYRLHSFL